MESELAKGIRILDLPMRPNDSGADTIRGYLKALLVALWEQGESFSGKRPLGNSCWEGDLELPLVEAGIVEGKLDEDGWLESVDSTAAAHAIGLAIKAL